MKSNTNNTIYYTYIYNKKTRSQNYTIYTTWKHKEKRKEKKIQAISQNNTIYTVSQITLFTHDTY